ncbi:TIGR03619 family F420-dependent LLM class oxidoreductase [Ktedonobacter racemifer]|uniref:TIGR03619 family F420-dependent LLM class oxidoreductase n=1 Tax=Ktedonobacter racemifer TaxID=363277 RepID=UPI0003130461|nr:TIGR03619 family F420-dependent LLM class oxidoreductase [Ktedonobacter racemifer]
MAQVDFGLMLRPTNPGDSFQNLMQYNRQCVEALSPAFTTLWLEDHLEVGANDHLEALTTLTYLAAQYQRFKVGTLVLSQSYRNPALLAKMAANIQALTGGRLILGVGAGWKEDEYRAYGYPFPSVKERMSQLEDTVNILRALWQSQPASFEGAFYQIQDAYCAPRPEPSIPILIGGGGEQRTLAIVARHADWWNFNSCPVEEYARKLAILRQHCERIGRNPDEIKLTYLGTLSASADPAQVQRHPQKHYIAGNASEVRQELEQFQAIGVTHFIFRIPNLQTLHYFNEQVAPHFQ